MDPNNQQPQQYNPAPQQQPQQYPQQQPAQPGAQPQGQRLRIDENLLQELGLGQLPPQEKNRLLAQIYETLELRVGMTLANQMSDDQLKQFENFINTNDEQGALQWLEGNFPGYKQVVAQELEKLKQEVQQNAQAIIDAVNNPPQQPPQQQPQQPQYPQQQQPQQDYSQPPQQQQNYDQNQNYQSPQPPQPGQTYDPNQPQ